MNFQGMIEKMKTRKNYKSRKELKQSKQLETFKRKIRFICLCAIITDLTCCYISTVEADVKVYKIIHFITFLQHCFHSIVIIIPSLQDARHKHFLPFFYRALCHLHFFRLSQQDQFH